MHLRDVFREQIFLPRSDGSLELSDGVYRIRDGYSVLADASGVSLEILGPRYGDRLTVETALELGVLVLEEPRTRIPGDKTLGLVGRVGDVIHWEQGRVHVTYPVAGDRTARQD